MNIRTTQQHTHYRQQLKAMGIDQRKIDQLLQPQKKNSGWKSIKTLTETRLKKTSQN